MNWENEDLGLRVVFLILCIYLLFMAVLRLCCTAQTVGYVGLVAVVPGLAAPWHVGS